MFTKRARTYALIGAVALAGVLAVVIPALGSHDGRSAIVFTQTSGVAKFMFPGLDDQPIALGKGSCEITNAASGTLMKMSATGGAPGFNDLSIGVRGNGRNANGTPCSQVDVSEILSLTPGTALAGRKFSGVALDLEMTGNAIVQVVFVEGATTKTYSLHTGTNFQALCSSTPMANGCPGKSQDDPTTPAYEIVSGTGDLANACAAPNSSGPNNAGNDNCIWEIDPGGAYSSVTLKVKDVGTVSLEAGADTGRPSHFYLANAAPSASSVTMSTDEDNPVSKDVSSSISDDGGLADLVVTVDQTTVTDGALVSVSGKTITYDPNGQFESLDDDDIPPITRQFTYTVTDAFGASTSSTVTVSIEGKNDAPVISGSITVDEGSPGEPKSATQTIATDVDVERITVECDLLRRDADGTPIPKLDENGHPVVDQNGNTVYEVVGTLEDNGSGNVTFTTDGDFNTGTGSLTIQCTADDGTVKTSGTITLTITPTNDAPVANDDVYYVDVRADLATPLTPALTFNPITDGSGADSDIDNDQSALQVSSFDASNLVGGSLALGADNRTFTFQPTENFVGSTSFTYVISDGAATSNTATVTIYEVIDCGETLSVERGGVWARYTRTDGTPEECVEKPYELAIIEEGEPPTPVVKFVPREPVDGNGDPITVQATFSAELSFEPFLAAPGGADPADANELIYAADADNPSYVSMPWCVNPTLEWVLNANNELVEVLVTSAILPTDHDTWCIAYKRSYTEGGDVRTVWTVFGIGDPLKRLS